MMLTWSEQAANKQQNKDTECCIAYCALNTIAVQFVHHAINLIDMHTHAKFRRQRLGGFELASRGGNPSQLRWASPPLTRS